MFSRDFPPFFHPTKLIFAAIRYITFVNNKSELGDFADQFQELFEMILMSKKLDRILILPIFHLFGDEENESLELCTAEYLLEIENLEKVIEIREHSFLTNPIFSQNQNSPISRSLFIDVVGPGNKPISKSTSLDSLFVPGHRGFIQFISKKPKLYQSDAPIETSQFLSWLESDPDVQESRLLVFGSIRHKFSDLTANFSEEYLWQVYEAMQQKPAPHLSANK